MSNKFNFTKASLDAIQLPPSERRRRVYDTKIRGLLLDVTSAGTKTFYVRRKIRGRSDWERLGPYADLTIEQARGKASEINALIAQGKDPQLIRQEASAELTLGLLFQKYMERHAKKKSKTWAVMEKDFERNLKHLKNRKLSSITYYDVEKLHGKLGDSRGQYTANRTIQLLRAVYNKGIAWKLYGGDNPAARITLFSEKARERFLSGEEVKRLFLTLKDEPSESLRDFVMLSLLTGARKSNILSMRWGDIDFEKGTWTIPETKNGTSQTIALTGTEIALLNDRRRTIDGEFVFPGTGKSGHLMDPKKSWTKLLQRAEIQDCTIHDLRRNLGSWMASQNVNLALIKGVLNHKDMKTTVAVYARTAKDAELRSREAAHEAMFVAAGLKPKPTAHTKKLKRIK